ncbi:VPLPA-CTERM sorting domain-containing protein [Rubrimonas cliftonensis]|uniref:VPLPA-CTERM protein sorting domain-containing protein n=1 Tax=Rubrimonas cliftonensis TaxID=89524 RepID=A0A1H4CU98_9RHOB|nr:VPLPA-CTERM sorting domain-containing protein [Rubrimonas cliftonensis]SEA63936.1 VPLPA-CTERM protein sorting domain-containing protein [Rubrimonas cliftonensis]
MRMAYGVLAGFLASATAASAATIDFTDASVWSSGASTQTVFGSTVSLSASGGAINFTPFDGGAAVPGLASINDGVGVNDDEVSPRETLTVMFSAPLFLTAVSFLDLFIAPDGSEEEFAIGSSDGAMLFTVSAVQDAAAGEPGFATYVLPTPTVVSSITFTVGGTNDAQGVPDFALASLDVEAVPLPATAWMLLAGVAGIGYVSRRRYA